MSKLPTIVAALVAGIGFTTAVVAQEATYWNPSEVQSTKSRAEVRAEAAAALRAGQLERGEASYFVIETNGPSKTRAQVMAEAREAQRLDVLGRGEANAFITPEQSEQIRLAGLRAIDPSLARAN
jgi:hypothetical protein